MVKVVLEGANPYVSVNRKLDGSYALKYSLVFVKVVEFLMLVGFGTTTSSSWPVIPDPNWTCKLPLDKNLVTNLLGTFLRVRLLGTSALSVPELSVLSKIVSWPK